MLKRLIERVKRLFRPRVGPDDAMMAYVASLCFQTGKPVYATVDEEGRVTVEVIEPQEEAPDAP